MRARGAAPRHDHRLDQILDPSHCGGSRSFAMDARTHAPELLGGRDRTRGLLQARFEQLFHWKSIFAKKKEQT